MNNEIKEIRKLVRSLFKKYTINPKTVYGDTDSIFVDYQITTKDGVKAETEEALWYAIELGKLCGELIKSVLPYPHDLEYEKTFWPFIIITKKRYVGNLFEFDVKKYKQKSMGIVLKRRDNASIVKILVGGIVDKILNERSSENAIKFCHEVLRNMLKDKYDLDKFVTTKTLKKHYEDRTKIAHAVLADRMTERDPGNAPSSNDRIPYAAVEIDEKKLIKDKTEFRRKGIRSFMKKLEKTEIESKYMDVIKNIHKIIFEFFSGLKLDTTNIKNVLTKLKDNNWDRIVQKLEKEKEEKKKIKYLSKKAIIILINNINYECKRKIDIDMITKSSREISEKYYEHIENIFNKSKEKEKNKIRFEIDVMFEFKKMFKSIIRKHGSEKASIIQGDRVEHPNYIISQKLKLDYLFYITNQMMKPAIQFLELLVDNPDKIFEKYINEEINRRKGKIDFKKFFSENSFNSDQISFLDDIMDRKMEEKIISDKKSQNPNQRKSIKKLLKNQLKLIKRVKYC